MVGREYRICIGQLCVCFLIHEQLHNCQLLVEVGEVWNEKYEPTALIFKQLSRVNSEAISWAVTGDAHCQLLVEVGRD